MASEIRTLKSGDTQVLPRTVSNAVTNTDGTTVQQHIDNKSNPHVVTIQQIGAAPEGFGLGESSAKPIEDFNAAWMSGWYYTTSSDIGIAHWPDGMSRYCLVRTDCRGSSAYQTAYDSGKMAVRFTQKTSNPEAWKPWEWVNPPMQIGVEYRTTERYKGKPVYARLLEVTGFGTPGTISEVSVDVGEALNNLVSFAAQDSTGWAFPTLMYGGGSGASLNSNGNIQVEVRAAGQNIFIYLYSESRDMSKETCYFLVKYTKSND